MLSGSESGGGDPQASGDAPSEKRVRTIQRRPGRLDENTR